MLKIKIVFKVNLKSEQSEKEMEGSFQLSKCRTYSHGSLSCDRSTHIDSIYRIRIRIAVFGAAGVGKSSIIKHFLHKQYPKNYRRNFDEMFVVEYCSNGCSMEFEILDSSSAYDSMAARALTISESSVFLLVYAVNNENSWTYIKNLRDEVCSNRSFILVEYICLCSII